MWFRALWVRIPSPTPPVQIYGFGIMFRNRFFCLNARGLVFQIMQIVSAKSELCSQLVFPGKKRRNHKMGSVSIMRLGYQCFSLQSSMRTPPVDLGCRKAISAPCAPGRGSLSMRRIPSSAEFLRASGRSSTANAIC